MKEQSDIIEIVFEDKDNNKVVWEKEIYPSVIAIIDDGDDFSNLDVEPNICTVVEGGEGKPPSLADYVRIVNALGYVVLTDSEKILLRESSTIFYDDKDKNKREYPAIVGFL